MTRPADPPQADPQRTNAHALVIGGGVAGLLSALMLKERFARVTVLERSEFAELSHDAPSTRPSVPQSHCLHMLMGAGANAFDALAPGWRNALLDRGAIAYDAGTDVALRVTSGWLPRVQTGITLYGASRCLIEAALLDLLPDAGSVEVRTGAWVTGLVLTPDGTRVQGVQVKEEGGRALVLETPDIVVDASGAASRLPRWLAQHFGDTPAIERTEVATGRQYASCWVRFAPDQTPGWNGLAIAPSHVSNGYAGMMMRAENDLWGVVLQTPESAELPNETDKFMALLANLADSELYNALRHALPASPVHVYGRIANRRRHYEDFPSWPRNLFAVGDSVCALDPYAGLGMTAAARGIQLLGHYLDENPSVEAKNRFQSRLARHNIWPWRIATGDWNGPTSPPGLAKRIDSLVQAAPFDPSLARELLDILHMLREPETLTQEAVA